MTDGKIDYMAALSDTPRPKPDPTAELLGYYVAEIARLQALLRAECEHGRRLMVAVSHLKEAAECGRASLSGLSPRPEEAAWRDGVVERIENVVEMADGLLLPTAKDA